MKNFLHLFPVSISSLSWVVGGPAGGRVHPEVTGSPGWEQKFARTVEVVVLVVRGTDPERRGPEMERRGNSAYA